jgi:hypothetical protein
MAMLVGLFAAPALAAGLDEPLERVEIARDGSPILIPVRLGGKTYSFLLTTTLPRTLIDSALEKHLGKPKAYYAVTYADGTVKRKPVYYAPDAKIGKTLSLKNGGVVAIKDLKHIREITGLDIRGMIGMSFLRQYTIRINFDRGELDFYPPLPPAAKPLEFGTKLTVDYSRDLPIVSGKLFGYPMKFLVHLSYPGSGMIASKQFTKFMTGGQIKRTKLTMLERDKTTIRSMMARVKAFTLNGIGTFTNILLDSGQTNVLGLGFFRRFHLTLDFSNGRMFFTPSKQYRVLDQADMSGLHLLSTWNDKNSEKVYISAVAKGSPAKLAGLKQGDILVKLNGQNVLDYTLAAIRNFLKSKPKQRVEIIFQRGTKLYKTAFILKAQI